MLRDWNFWCTVMTSVAAVVAIGVSVHQIRLSNKQQLFERRLKAYMMANSIISLCKENYVYDLTHNFCEWQEFILRIATP